MDQESNEKYQEWILKNIDRFCNNSSNLSRVALVLMTKKVIDDGQRKKILAIVGDTDQFLELYMTIQRAGLQRIDLVIEALSKANQGHIAAEFETFKAENVHQNTKNENENIGKQQAKRTKDDKRLVGVNNPKQSMPENIRISVDEIDFVNNMEPLTVEVKSASEYQDVDDGTYKMRSDPRGFALVINNINFADSCKSRQGAEKDTIYMANLLQGLKYNVTIEEDVEFSGFSDILKNFKKNFETTSVDSCIVVVMSHGGSNTVDLVDGESINLWQDIVYKFDNFSCPRLIGKPKIFIIQACQNFENPIPRTGTDASMPRVSDTLVCFSTIPGDVSHRDMFLGSWYIYCLTKVFMENSHTLEITKMLQKLAIEVMTKLKTEQDITQISTYQPFLFKDFYFNPGL